LGALFFAALLLDIVLWALVLTGTESVHSPPDYQTAADMTYDFPFSHSLAASLAWSVLAAAVCLLWWGTRLSRARAALVIAAAVLSHFVLDWLVHIPELPVLGDGSSKLGLGLWRHLTVAWCVEGLVAVAGVWLYLRAVALAPVKRAALIFVMALVMGLTILGQAREGPPPTPVQMAVSSLVTIATLVAFGFWVDRSKSIQGKEQP
jgi:hypothetical protein